MPASYLSLAGVWGNEELPPPSPQIVGTRHGNSFGAAGAGLSMCTRGVLNPRVADVINNNVSFGAVSTYHVNVWFGSF